MSMYIKQSWVLLLVVMWYSVLSKMWYVHKSKWYNSAINCVCVCVCARVYVCMYVCVCVCVWVCLYDEVFVKGEKTDWYNIRKLHRITTIWHALQWGKKQNFKIQNTKWQKDISCTHKTHYMTHTHTHPLSLSDCQTVHTTDTNTPQVFPNDL